MGYGSQELHHISKCWDSLVAPAMPTEIGVEVDLRQKNTRIQNQIGPFHKISIDPLGPVLVKAFPGSRKKVKCYPLIAKCLNSAAIQMMLMETME